ncbi:MAG: hypothetical protein ACOC9S_01740 [Planctomycetota bacterium]
MVRKLSITVFVLAGAVLIGCNTAESAAGGNPGEQMVASSNSNVRLGAGDQLGENMFRHYAEVARSRKERLAEARSERQTTHAESDNVSSWFVVLPHRRVVVYPGVTVVQQADGQVHDATTIHQLLPL